MNIQQLIASSAEIYSVGILERGEKSHYSDTYTFNHKQFGQVLQYNKTVIYKPNYSIIEIGMYITSVTETGKTGHFCQVALKGVDMKPVSKNDIFKKVRERSGGKFSDYTDEQIIDYVARGGTVYNGKYVVQSRTDSNKYLVMNKRISAETEARVRCSCASFFFDIAWYNGDHNCLIGSRPPANPRFKMGDTKTIRNVHKKPGLCKHLMLLFSLLLKDDFIVGGTDDVNGIAEMGQKIYNSRKNQERISTARANFYIDKVMKETKAQIKSVNQLNQGLRTPKSLNKVKVGGIGGKAVKSYIKSMKSMYKQLNPAQRQKLLYKRNKKDDYDTGEW